jgi:hypothetical protein
MLLAALELLFGCGGEPARSVDDPAVDGGWIDVIADRTRFDTQMKTDGRPAWIALHAGRLEDAWAAMETDAGRARAEVELAELHDALSDVHRHAAIALATEWDEAPEAVVDAGEAAADCATRPASPELAERFDLPAAKPPEQRASEPVWTLEEEGFTRVVHDPCASFRMARDWRPAESPEGLPASLFGPLPMQPSETLDAEAARVDLRRIDATLDALRTRHPDDDGVFAGLGVYGIARIRTAAMLAGQALDDAERLEQVEYARTLLQLAPPPERPAVGPMTPPVVYARLAEAELRSGRTRQALDWLAPLGDTATGVRETVSDLAVLRSLSHVGDSKETP